MDESFRIIPFEERYFKPLINLIKEGWNENHIFLKSEELLRWEYTGYGSLSGMHFPLLFDGEMLIGFRLMTPIEIMISKGNCGKIIVPTAVSTVWFLKKEYRGKKLGLKMQLYTIDKYNGYFAIASNLKTSAPMHKKAGAKMLDTMLRYFRPLQEDISILLVEECGIPWKYNKPQNIIAPNAICAAELEEKWNNSIKGKNITALNRSRAFWQWRYLDSPIYKYHIFKDVSGILVGRVCELYDVKEQKSKEKVFRVLELIPENSEVWDGKADKSLSCFIDGVCGWAKGQGCIATEFYLSTSRFDTVLNDASFVEINMREPLASSVMSYFEPMSSSHRLSNVTVQSSKLEDDFIFENSYFTLSDADQDRPNIISLKYE